MVDRLSREELEEIAEEAARKVISKADMNAIAEEAARKAMVHFFRFLDVDAEDHASVKRLREDLSFLTRQREGSAMIKETVRKSSLYLVGAAIIGLTYFVWDVFKEGFTLWLSRAN